MKYIKLGFICLLCLLTMSCIVSADSNRFNVISTTQISDYNLIIVQDTQNQNMLYITEQGNNFDFNVVRTNYEGTEADTNNAKLNVENIEQLSNGFNIVAAQDTSNGSEVYIVSNGDVFKTQVVPNTKLSMW